MCARTLVLATPLPSYVYFTVRCAPPGVPSPLPSQQEFAITPYPHYFQYDPARSTTRMDSVRSKNTGGGGGCRLLWLTTPTSRCAVHGRTSPGTRHRSRITTLLMPGRGGRAGICLWR